VSKAISDSAIVEVSGRSVVQLSPGLAKELGQDTLEVRIPYYSSSNSRTTETVHPRFGHWVVTRTEKELKVQANMKNIVDAVEDSTGINTIKCGTEGSVEKHLVPPINLTFEVLVKYRQGDMMRALWDATNRSVSMYDILAAQLGIPLFSEIVPIQRRLELLEDAKLYFPGTDALSAQYRRDAYKRSLDFEFRRSSDRKNDYIENTYSGYTDCIGVRQSSFVFSYDFLNPPAESASTG